MRYTQGDWSQRKLVQSTATWNIIGLQALMTKMLLPAELLSLTAITSGHVKPDTLFIMNQQITE